MGLYVGIVVANMVRRNIGGILQGEDGIDVGNVIAYWIREKEGCAMNAKKSRGKV